MAEYNSVAEDESEYFLQEKILTLNGVSPVHFHWPLANGVRNED